MAHFFDETFLLDNTMSKQTLFWIFIISGAWLLLFIVLPLDAYENKELTKRIKANFQKNKTHYNNIAKILNNRNVPCDFGIETTREQPVSIRIKKCKNYRDTAINEIKKYYPDLKKFNYIISSKLHLLSIHKHDYYISSFGSNIRNLDLEYPSFIYTKDIERYISENNYDYIEDINSIKEVEDFVYKLDKNWYMVLKDKEGNHLLSIDEPFVNAVKNKYFK